jgi:hypothetical protein
MQETFLKGFWSVNGGRIESFEVELGKGREGKGREGCVG